MIRWKVVNNRYSTGGSYTPKEFCLSYQPASIVVSPVGSLGIFTFKTKKDAKRFALGLPSNT